MHNYSPQARASWMHPISLPGCDANRWPDNTYASIHS
jgi:hypothetical protein